MATIAYVILFLTLASTIHARESQFFAKVSNNPKETLPLNTNQNFVPQSQNEEGDAFGHESGQLPPSSTNNNNNNNNNKNNNNLPSYLPENYNPVAYTTPIHSSTQDIPNEFNDPQEYNTESTMYNSQNQNELMETNGGNMYNAGKQGMSDTRFMENGKYYYGNNGYNSPKQGFEDTRFMETQDGDNMYKSPKQGFEDTRFTETQDGGNMYNSQKQNEGMYNSQRQGMGETRYGISNNANMYNPEKQGMSDTRFLENGKYFYDLNMENANLNANMNSRNEYNTQGYYGNNENSYDRYNSNGGYQNQEEFQGEQFDP